MPRTRLELALSLVSGSDWRAFEKFAAEFLSVEYPAMRTTASPSGDGGRDAEIYVPLEEPSTAVQISVRHDWAPKIRETVSRLAMTFPDVTELIYVTNQTIGASADGLKKELRKDSGISLDIRDSNWFLEREHTHPQRAVASERLAEQFVDPILPRGGANPAGEPRLSGDESRIALLQLVLDVRDTSGDRNLTKSCFESLVIAALRGTSTENRISRVAVKAAIKSLVPAGTPGQLEALVDGALTRMSRKHGPVKHIRTTDEFQLSHDETLRLKEQTERFLLDERQLESELISRVAALSNEADNSEDHSALGILLRETLERVLLQHSEAFAASITTGETVHLDAEALLTAVQLISPQLPTTAEQATAAIRDVLATPSVAMNTHLRRLSDSYTLFAFLRQTPDVQKVVLSVFSEGSIWLDTSAILPLIAETLVDEPERRYYTQLLQAAIDAGLQLYVTPGVIEEVERHLNRCVAFGHVPKDQWNGRVPFIYSAYILSGRASNQFVSWQDQIRGRARPEEDVRDYLDEEFAIQERSLQEIAEGADIELRAAVQELWMEQHDLRRNAGDDSATDALSVGRLVAHDVENTVGVLELRKSERPSPMGYRSWWLTMDKTALRIKSYLKDRLGEAAPLASPALSPDFLSQYLRLGPMRVAVEKGHHVSLPVITDMSRLENVPRSLIELSDSIRIENAGLDERVLRRKVRDSMDYERTRQGPMSVSGVRQLEQDIKIQITRP